MIWRRNIALIGLLLVIGITGYAQSPDTIQTIPAAEFASLIDSFPHAQRVDVRTKKEYQQGHIEGFTNRDVLREKRFKRQVAKLDRNKPVFLYCRSGKRSHHAAQLLNEMGFVQVIELDGGYLAWQEIRKECL
ncbi:rhodanese-like domain-containing protein [Parapedobacter sp. ISTM3]|uniref:rhodanese-like domain-containing protein n=1 Tax=Parapedobacter sp. ISTM3 TaxID=2800130 RepID=UPI001907F0EE|nr:rhodanese-like domain-containing protein [Parapedobacter sp. ISTM3]MBK1441479.1 rhodanese-like domain-containing protein [Parapedobacter sp. ISTM3]